MIDQLIKKVFAESYPMHHQERYKFEEGEGGSFGVVSFSFKHLNHCTFLLMAVVQDG